RSDQDAWEEKVGPNVISSLRSSCPRSQADLWHRSAPRAACTLARLAFRQSTVRRPVSIARIVQRRAAVQNDLRCAREQNLCADPPVLRGLKARSHQRQCAVSASSETTRRSATSVDSIIAELFTPEFPITIVPAQT